jgi:hypothetical protein
MLDYMYFICNGAPYTLLLCQTTILPHHLVMRSPEYRRIRGLKCHTPDRLCLVTFSHPGGLKAWKS